MAVEEPDGSKFVNGPQLIALVGFRLSAAFFLSPDFAQEFVLPSGKQILISELSDEEQHKYPHRLAKITYLP